MKRFIHDPLFTGFEMAYAMACGALLGFAFYYFGH